jgi:tetratricopeptide (TPR) repeat protein
MTTLHIQQDALENGLYLIRLTVREDGDLKGQAEAKIKFALTEREREDMRWYLEDYVQYAGVTEAVIVEQIEAAVRARGEELYKKVLVDNPNSQKLWFSIYDKLADLRIEIATGVAEAASIPWELMRDPKLDSPVSLRVREFVRVQSNPNISFIPIPPSQDGRIRLLYIACRPRETEYVELRAVANRLLQDLGPERARFEIKALRPPTFERLQKELADAKAAGRPYHIVHFDGHGTYTDTGRTGKHGYLLFEHAGEDNVRPVDGQMLGQLLHDSGVPVLVLNACQSAMHKAVAAPKTVGDFHEEVRAIGSLAQAVVDQGIPAVLGMRYSVYVVTAAQYIGELYGALAKGRSFGEAATEGRKHLERNPERWLGLMPRSLQDWFVPVAYEAEPIRLCHGESSTVLIRHPELDPVQINSKLLRYVPGEGFIGRDETILALDRAFDEHRVVLLHACAGQGKSSTAVEFARWYSVTGGLGAQPIVLLASFESHIDLTDLLNQIGQFFSQILAAQGKYWSAINDKDERRRLVLQILRQFPVLWIWDNVEPISGFPDGTASQWTGEEQTDIRDFLEQIKLDAASRGKILLTSRRDERKWLGSIPHPIPMRPMSKSDAAKLALKLGAENGLKRSEILDWQSLLDYCAGNPLTLRVLVGQAVKAGLRGKRQIADFVETIRSGEEHIEDADEKQGHDKSLGASLDYGFRQAFKDDELRIVALLYLFQDTVMADVLRVMGQITENALPELKGRSTEHLTGLLERAKDSGLLADLGGTLFSIHPALPWFFRPLFVHHYDGQAGRSSSQTALRAWVEAVGLLGNYYHRAYDEGNRLVIKSLEMQEANLLQAHHLARQNQWWSLVISCMQGLCILYEYRGRAAEWARLVEEIRPIYCTDDNRPISGREEEYDLVMAYRVRLAEGYEHDLDKAAALQECVVGFDRERAAFGQALPPDAPLDEENRNRLRTLGVSVFTLGQLRRLQGDAASLALSRESLAIHRRIGDISAQAADEYELGSVYMDVPSLRDLGSAEAAFKRSLDLLNPSDVLGRSRCVHQIGLVHHLRFTEARKRKEPADTLLRHLQAAEARYLEALRLCPRDAIKDLAPMHNSLGNLYADVAQQDQAREHYEQAALYDENAGSQFDAGRTRFNMAVMYIQAATRESQSSQRRVSAFRARAYAEAALRDFQHYHGRAAKDEDKAQTLLDNINQFIAKLPH